MSVPFTADVIRNPFSAPLRRYGTASDPLGSGSTIVSYLVDPASSHMLVSKIKPCMSKYKQLYTVKLRMAHYISYNLFDSTLLLG